MMKFPCPHCGSDESYYDRSAEEFKPIIPVELQGDFEEPPPPVSTPGYTPVQEMKPVSKPAETSSSFVSPQQEQIQSTRIDYEFQSSASSPDYTADKRLEIIERTIRIMENEIKTLTSDMKTIIKSQKVIESILTNINKKVLNLPKE